MSEFVVAVLMLLGGGAWDGASEAGSVTAPAPGVEVTAGTVTPHRHQQEGQAGSCEALVDRMCTVATSQMCRTLKREHARRALTEQEEAQCRDLLDNPRRLDELLRRLRP